MKMILLQHDGRLGVAPDQSGPIPAGWKPPVDGATLLSFRPPTGRPPDRVVSGLNGTSRLSDDFGPDVCTYAFETDTFLSPLLFWDLAHKIPVGGSVTTAGSGVGVPYLARDYFRGGLTVESRSATHTTFRKTAPLLVEQDRGLKRWTFGIPTGPGDATGLNACVRRVLELGVPEFEIVLCGRPGPNFKYFDEVRIVGEELSKPPVLIGKKKNVLAEAARYENLCLFHDRVFLSKDFYAAVTAFGDDYPIANFQSVWFDDPYNLIMKRYSDYGCPRNGWTLGVVSDPDGTGSFFDKDFFVAEPAGCFYYANPLRYHQTNYCTGSLYLAKRSLWRAYPQSDTLEWAQFEDIEHALRASKAGVPSRVNPYAFSQTIFGRASLRNSGVLFELPDGRVDQSVSPLEVVKFARKPLIRWSHAEAQERLAAFARKYVPAELLEQCLGELNRPGTATADWARKVAVAVYAARIRFGEEAVLEFIEDIAKHFMGDAITFAGQRFYAECFALHGTLARDHFVEHSPHLRTALFYRPHGNLFYDSLAEYFPERTRRLKLGTAWTARRLARHNGMLFSHPGGTAKDYEAAILNSTPFSDYYEAAR